MAGDPYLASTREGLEKASSPRDKQQATVLALAESAADLA